MLIMNVIISKTLRSTVKSLSRDHESTNNYCCTELIKSILQLLSVKNYHVV